MSEIEQTIKRMPQSDVNLRGRICVGVQPQQCYGAANLIYESSYGKTWSMEAALQRS